MAAVPDHDIDVHYWNNLVSEAVRAWRTFYNIKQLPEDECDAFARFLGDPNDGTRYYRVDILRPEIRDLVSKIAGPHGNTILKMLEIKNAENSQR